jgi:hypothetical protein
MRRPMNVGAGPFDWRPQPRAAAFVFETLRRFCRACRAARDLAERLHQQTGTRLLDWVDHFAVPSEPGLEARLTKLGFVATARGPCRVWEHPNGLFPAVETRPKPASTRSSGPPIREDGRGSSTLRQAFRRRTSRNPLAIPDPVSPGLIDGGRLVTTRRRPSQR